MKIFRALWLGVLTCLLLACGGYDDDGGVKSGTANDSGEAEALESTEFFLAVTLPGGQTASAQERASGREARGVLARESAVNGLVLDNFSAEVLVPDINELDRYREVVVAVTRFVDLGGGIYSVEIDGTPRVDTIIYVTVNSVRMKVLALAAGSRSAPIRVNLQTTAAVELFLEQVAEGELNLEDLAIEEVQDTLEEIVDYLETVEVPEGLTEEEQLDYLKEEATDACSIDADGNVGGGCNVTYRIGGTVSGLQGSVVLALQNDEQLTLAADGAFLFDSAFPDATDYVVTVLAQPLLQTCTLVNDSGTIAAADVDNLELTCVDVPLYRVGGSATGVAGDVQVGLNGTERLTISSSGQFQFETTLEEGTPFNLSLLSSPAGYTCELTPSDDVIGQEDYTTAALDCAPIPTFSVGGSVTGLNGTVTLMLTGDVGPEAMPVTASGMFEFASTLLDASAFEVTITEQPATQTCTITQGTPSGTIASASISDIVVTCVDTPYTVGGTVSGLQGDITLVLNGDESLLVTLDGSFTFTTPLVSSDAYAVTIATQPTSQICTIDGKSSGTVAAENITSIVVTCDMLAYTVGGTFSGLQGNVRLLLNGLEALTIAADGTYTFTTPVQSGSAYQVALVEQPAGQHCTLSDTSGVMPASNVTNVNGVCIAQNLSVGGMVSGMQGQLLLQLQSNTSYEVLETLVLTANGAYAFDTGFGAGDTYSVSVTGQPIGLTCVIVNNTGTVAATSVTDVDLTCSTRQIPPSFSLESAQVVLPGEEIRLAGASLDDASITVDGTAMTPQRQSYGYVSFVAPALSTGTHVVRTTNSAGTYSEGVQWGERMTAVQSIAPGSSHTCALQQDGSVLCWGDNSYGQLGNNDAQYAGAVVPYRVSGLVDAVQLESGAFFSCARRQTGAIVCWGNNASGELGGGSAEPNQVSPLTVSGISNAQQLSVGHNHACVLLTDQTVQCWGNNNQGQLGDATTTNSNVPVTVTDLSGVTTIEAGTFTTCAIMADTSVRCWGHNGSGQLGNGTTVNSLAPSAVTGLANVVELAAGTGHVCALQATGNVSCWGANGGRQLGNDTFADGFSSVPVPTNAVSGVQALAAGQQHNCAVLSDGTVACWGFDNNGERGRGYYQYAPDPAAVVVPGIATAASISASNSATCVVPNGQAARCWGSNTSGMLGRGTSSIAQGDYVYRLPIASPLFASADFDAGYETMCAIAASGGVSCLGGNASGQLGAGVTERYSTTPLNVSGIGDAAAVSVGQSHACAVLQGGGVQCWGDNTYGQLGNGVDDGLPTFVPVTVSGVTTALDIASSGDHACAVLQSGRVQCWGSNDEGQLGTGGGAAVPPTSSVPVNVATLTDATAVAVTSGASCALHATGEVSCWGNNDYGQLGNGTTLDSSVPLRLPNIDAAVAISLSRYHGCALLNDGNIQCWGGGNSNTVLGDGSVGGMPRRPTLVKGLPAAAVSLSTGASHTCTALDTGAVYCWGDNSSEQLGDRANDYGWPPVQVRGITTATAVGVSDDYSCARLQDGSLQCWGVNRSQMGPGDAPKNSDVRFVSENHVISVNVTGASDYVSVSLNGIESISAYNGETAFTTTLPVDQAYTVSIVTEPTGQICTADQLTGTIGSSDVVVNITCQADSNTITVTTSGLTGFGLIINLAADPINENLQVINDGDDVFVDRVPVGDTYLLTFVQQPLGQTCEFTSGQGNSTGGVSALNTPIAVALTCVDLPYTVTGAVTGLQSGTVTMLFSGVEMFDHSAVSAFTFDTALNDDDEYGVGLIGQPSGHYCTVINGNGFIDAQNVANVEVQCVPQPYHLSGTISNLVGTLVLSSTQSGSRSDSERIVRIAGDGTLAFTNAYADGDSYYVGVVQQPDGQFCSIDGAYAGTFSGADISNVSITCVASTDLPVINSVAPATVLSGEQVVVRGYYLAGASLTVDGQSVTPLTQSSTHIEFLAPSLSTGSYAVAVTNGNGIGNATIAYGTQPTTVDTVAGGSEFSCLRQTDGSVRCFGYNGYGQLGIGDVALPNGIATTPLDIPNLSGTLAISLGAYHACAIGATDQVLCWGSNVYGELGIGTNVNSTAPLLVTGINAAQISAGGYHTCVVTTGAAEVFCWGSNFHGELGDGTTVNSNVPVQVPNLSNVVMVASGESHTCALMGSPGTLRCWGYNPDGRLGDGTTTNSLIPVEVSGITTAVAVAVGYTHSCALLASGEVNCWGDNTLYQLGNPGLTEAFSATPVSVGETSSDPVSNLVAGSNFSCAVSATNEAVCWGNNDSGTLGDGTGRARALPAPVISVDNVVRVGAGTDHACAVRANGTARCWGRGFNGELGNGKAETRANYMYAKPVTHVFDSIGTVTHASMGLKHACAVIGGAVYCLGDNGHGQLGDGSHLSAGDPVQVSGITDAQRVYAGFEHTCALRTNSTVVCWGADTHGQIGAGLAGDDVTAPVQVSGLTGVTRLTAGYRHNCAINGTGAAYCWGDNGRGALGVGVFDGVHNVPAQVREITNATEIDASGSEGSTCVLLATGQVACWGANSLGELGHGSQTDAALPIVIPALVNVVAISTGGNNRISDLDDNQAAGTHCAIDTAGTVYCWGAGGAGQLGLGSGGYSRSVPTQVPLSRPALSVDVGGEHGCAVLNNNTVECWGSNQRGQLGIGVDNSEQWLPTSVFGMFNATQISVSRHYGCALLTGGGLQCWGENPWAQMGSALMDVTRSVRYAP